MDIRDLISEYCNPVNAKDLVRLVNIFDDLDYDEYIGELYDKIEESIDNDSGNVGRLIGNLINNHAYTVLKELGIVLSNEVEDVTTKELLEILNFNLLLEYSDKDKADEILNALEVNDDTIYAFSEVISKDTSINSVRLYELIESIDVGFINTLTEVLTNISDNDTEDIFNYDIIAVIKDLRVTDASEITGLRIIRNDYGEDKELEELIRNNIDKVFNPDLKVTAVNIMSLIILGSDSRFDRLESYIKYFEDLIEDEHYKMQLYKELTSLDSKVESLYVKYNIIKEEV